jgi:cytochrome oxidase assembly protein ShyY1
MTPLVTASGTTVVVNRGWIPRHFLTSDQPWKKPTEPVKVVGIPFKGESAYTSMYCIMIMPHNIVFVVS